MKNKKIILFLFIAILAIGLLISVFYFNSKKTETNKNINIEKIEKIENKKVYYDDKYNFTFNYPSNLIYKIEDNKKELLSETDRVIILGLDNNGPWNVSININKDTKYKDIEDWLSDYVKNSPKEIIIIRENTNINIDKSNAIITHMAGLDAKKEYVYEDYPYEKTVAFIKNNNLFVINIDEGVGSESYIDFLKSFKFIK